MQKRADFSDLRKSCSHYLERPVRKEDAPELHVPGCRATSSVRNREGRPSKRARDKARAARRYEKSMDPQGAGRTDWQESAQSGGRRPARQYTIEQLLQREGLQAKTLAMKMTRPVLIKFCREHGLQSESQTKRDMAAAIIAHHQLQTCSDCGGAGVEASGRDVDSSGEGKRVLRA